MAHLPAPGDERDRPLWEYVTLELASRAGLRIAECRLEKVAGRNVLLVRRCDRVGAQRIPFLSGRSFLQARGHSETDLAGMATVLQQEGGAVRKDLQEIWNRLVFSACVHATNSDLGSWGFMREDFGWRLAPVGSLLSRPCLGRALLVRACCMKAPWMLLPHGLCGWPICSV